MKTVGIVALVLIVIAVYEWGTISTLLGLRYPKANPRKRSTAQTGHEDSPLETEEIEISFLAGSQTHMLANQSAKTQAGKSDKDTGSAGALAALIKSQSYPAQRSQRMQQAGTRGRTNAASEDPSGQAQNQTVLKESPVAKLITPAELKLLIDAGSEKWKALMTLACYTGIRDVELIGLFWEDVDFSKSTIRVERIYAGDKFSDPEPATIKRTVIAPPAVIKSLQEHKAYLKEKGVPTGHTLIFLGSSGKGLNEKLLKSIFETTVESAGLGTKDLHFEDLRYSYAWALLNAGETADFIHRQLGYPTPKNKMKNLQPFPPGFEVAKARQLASVFSLQQ